MKKLFTLILCFLMISSAGMLANAADVAKNYDAPYAGVYQLTSDKAVTVTSELGAKATLLAGETEYIYLLKGVNNLTVNNASANLTFTSLPNNGMDCFKEVLIAKEPVISGQEDSVKKGLNKTLAPGESYTVTYTPSKGKAGLVYPYIYFSDANENIFRITSDTGFYADILKPMGLHNTLACADAASDDLEMLYVRSGANKITITNIGKQMGVISNISFHSVGELLTMKWKDQLNVANLKPIIESDTFSAITLNGRAKTATVSFTNYNTADDGQVLLALVSYDNNQMTAVDVTVIDTDAQPVGTTREYTVDLPEANGTLLRAMLLNENLEPKAEFQDAEIKNINTDSFAGKKLSILGDSVSTFDGWSNNPKINSTLSSNAVEYFGNNHGISSVDETWWKQLADQTGMEILVNNSYSGDKVCNHAQKRSVQLHNNEGETPDVIVVFMGVNDVRGFCSVANFTSNYSQIIKNITREYPDAEVYLLNMVYYLYQSEAICSVIESVADTYGCTYVDVRNNAGITPSNYTNYMAADETEKLHPNSAGMDLITDCVIEAMRK